MTITEAKDEICGIIFAAVQDAIDASIVPTIQIHWPSLPQLSAPPTNGFWMRVFYTALNDEQVSLAKNKGVSKFGATGQIVATIYSPISIPGSADNGTLLAEYIRDAFRVPGPSGWMTFTNHRVRDINNTDTHFQTNVLVNCAYEHYQGAPAIVPVVGDTEVLTLTAAATISAYFAVASSGANSCVAADSTNVALPAVGINTGAVVMGGAASIQFGGPITFNGWNWTPGLPIFVGPGGNLTQTPPLTGYQQIAGYPVSPTTFIIEIEDAVQFG